MAAKTTNMPKRNDKTGRYTPGFDDEELLAALNDLDGAGGTTELADEIQANYDAVYQRLRRLEDEGRVRRRKIANANLWLLSDDSHKQQDSV